MTDVVTTMKTAVNDSFHCLVMTSRGTEIKVLRKLGATRTRDCSLVQRERRSGINQESLTALDCDNDEEIIIKRRKNAYRETRRIISSRI